MANRRNRGTLEAPINILDSDEEPSTFGPSSFIDLTQVEPVWRQAPSVLQEADPENKNSSALLADDVSSDGLEHLTLSSSQLLSGKNQAPAYNFGDGAEVPTVPIATVSQVFNVNEDNLIGQRQRPSSEDDADSDIFDVNDRSTRRRVRRRQEREFPAAKGVHSNVSASSRQKTRAPSLELADITINRSPNGPNYIDQVTASLLLTVEEVLRSVWREMEQDHESYLKEQLLRASQRSSDLRVRQSAFSNATDPFAEISQIHDTNVVTQVQDKVSLRDRTTIGIDFDLFETPKRLPQYKHYIAITRSFLVPDNHDPPEDKQTSRQREHIYRLKEYLPRMLERVNLSREELLSHIIETGLVAIGPPDTPVARFAAAFETTFGFEVSKIFPEYDEYLRVTQKRSRCSEELDPVKKLLQPHLYSCPICHVYLCGIHGVYESDDSDDEEEDTNKRNKEAYADMNMRYESVIYRHRDKSKSLESTSGLVYDGKPCSADCFLNQNILTRKKREWALDQITYLKTLYLGMENETRTACILAPLLGRPCSDVQTLILSMAMEKVPQTNNEFRKTEKLDWYDNISKQIRVDLDWGKKTKTHLHHEARQQTGCQHLGVSCFDAKDDCSCNREAMLCNKFCACPDDCYMKFTGCNCSNGNDSRPCLQESQTCPCKLLNRECDPDLCQSCGATESANPSLQGENPPPDTCCNVDIQRGARKRLIVGESSHPGDIGFGAYTAEPIRAGEFFGEYVGEMISYAELGRRSDEYEKLGVWFIFDLNDEVTLDAFRYGNVERFINHSRKYANCKPCVKLVNGQHRIGFWATKDLDAGVELFFDYGRGFVAKQRLKEMDVMPKTRGGEGGTRNKITASRQNTRSSSKKTKESQKDVSHFYYGEEEEEEDEVMMDLNDEDSWTTSVNRFSEDNRSNEIEVDDMRRAVRRPRRNIRKPKKYTR